MKINTETKTIQIEVNFETYQDKYGEVYTLKDKDEFLEGFKETIESRVNNQNEHFQSQVEMANIQYDFEQIEVDMNALKNYDENDPESYRHFVNYIFKNFILAYDANSGAHKRWADIENILEERTEFIEKREEAKKDKETYREFQRNHRMSYGAEMSYYNYGKMYTIRDYVYHYLIHLNENKISSSLFHVTEDNFNDFVDFILDSGIATLDEELKSAGYFSQIKTFECLGFHLVRLAMGLRYYDGIDYLIEKGLTFEFLNSINFGEYLYSKIEQTYHKLIDYEGNISYKINPKLVKDLTKPVDDLSREVDGWYQYPNLRELYILTHKFHGVNLMIHEYGLLYPITTVDIERFVGKDMEFLGDYISEDLLEHNKGHKTDEYIFCENFIKKYVKSELHYTKVLNENRVRITVLRKLRREFYVNICNHLKEGYDEWNFDKAGDIEFNENEWYIYLFDRQPSKYVQGDDQLTIIKHVIPLSVAIQDEVTTLEVVDKWLAGDMVTPTDIERIVNKDSILDEIRQKELELCELKKKVGKEC